MSEELGKYVKGTGGIGVTLPAGMGSSTAGYRTIIRPTGTKKGWSQAPAEEEETEPAYRLIDILDDGEATVRHFIRAVLAKEMIFTCIGGEKVCRKQCMNKQF